MIKFKIFISHTNGPEDMTIVRKLASNLQLANVIVYVAEDDRQPGNYLAEKIKENIMNSDWVIGLWTENSARSAYVNQELGYAEGRKPNVLLVQKGVRVEGFSEGREYVALDPSDPMFGLNQMSEFIHDKKYEKEEDAKAANMFLMVVSIIGGLVLLWLALSGREEN